MTGDEVTFAELLAERVAQARTQQVALMNAIDDIRSARSLTFADDEHDPEGSTLSWDQARDAAPAGHRADPGRAHRRWTAAGGRNVRAV